MTLTRGQPGRLRMMSMVAPVGGLDTVAPATAIDPSRSILSYNLIGAEYGLRTRLGSREWVTGLDTDPRSILAFNGSTSASDRLFACTQAGIWDCSSSTAAPTKVVTFGIQNADSGYGIFTAFANTAGDHFLVYCDEANGMYVYAESGTTWTKVTAGTGVGHISEKTGVTTVCDPTKFVHVLSWKNRLWFCEKNTQRAWYLEIGSIYGDGATGASPFTFGSRFARGGDLRVLASHTMDGGSGPDDRLVAVSGGGDVVIYQGTDPSTGALADFGIVGVWELGQIPSGRRIATDTGGDLLIMSSIGILPVSKFTVGNPVFDRSQYQTAAISNLFNQFQATTSSVRGWAMKIHPLDSSLVVLVPQSASQPTTQLAMSLVTKGWHQYRDLPMGVCAEPWNGTLYFGSGDGSGRVLVNDGYVDGVTLADPNAYTPIDWSLLSGFSNFGSPQRKRLQEIRVKVMSQGGSIPMTAEARYDLDLSEAAIPSATAASSGSTWDSAKWDSGKWGGAYQVQNVKFGAYGSGYDVAVAIRGKSTTRMTLVGADAVYEAGGWR